jgi:PhoPQ-activated pathogenicity-related protein
MTVDKLAKYIQENIKPLLNQCDETIQLPRIDNIYIDSLALMVKKWDDNIKEVRLFSPDKYPKRGISSTCFLRGTDAEIVETVKKDDFAQKLHASINEHAYWLNYDDRQDWW